VASSADAAPADVAPATTPALSNPQVNSRRGSPSRQFSMAQVMESDEFSSYMSGVDRLNKGTL
jgi:hypothetical protein